MIIVLIRRTLIVIEKRNQINVHTDIYQKEIINSKNLGGGGEAAI